MQQFEIVAMSAEAMQVMLSDQTILPIRAIFDDTGHQVDDWDDAATMLVVDIRTTPSTLISIPIADIEFSPEA